MTEPLAKKRTCLYIEGNTLKQFKDICTREGENMSNKIEDYMTRYIAVHSEGNPQLRIDKFSEDVQKTKTCFFCQGRFPALKKVEFISGLVAPTCEACLGQKMKPPYKTVKRILGVA